MLEKHAVFRVEVVEAFPSALVFELERVLACLGDVLECKPELFTCELQFFIG